MTRNATIDERHFARLSAVARATRQDWATRRLTGLQRAPYAWETLAEVVGLRQLRDRLELSDVEVIWPQIRGEVSGWRPGRPAAALIDLVELSAVWGPSPQAAWKLLETGRAAQLFVLADALTVARTGFELAADAARARAGAKDELAGRRKAPKAS